MTTPTPKTARPSNADLQAMIEQQAAQIAALLAMASRAAETAPAGNQQTFATLSVDRVTGGPPHKSAPSPAPKAATNVKAPPDTSAIRWIRVNAGTAKPWTHKAGAVALSDRLALIGANNQPLIDAPASIAAKHPEQYRNGGFPIDAKYLRDLDALKTLTPLQMKTNGLQITGDIVKFTPKG